MGAYPVWTDTPACVGTDLEAWFTQGESSMYPNERALHKICNGCPVKVECYNYAVRHNVDGFWAGTTPRVRQLIRRELNMVVQEIYYSSAEKYGA